MFNNPQAGREMDWELFLDGAVGNRQALIKEPFQNALRLFNGFTEGCPDLTVDLYGRTVLITAGGTWDVLMEPIQAWVVKRLPFVQCVVQKIHGSPDPVKRRGSITYGEKPHHVIEENGVRYAINLMMNQDSSFYLDTRQLRVWLFEHAAGWQVLNTFAYTGSLGIAALAGGAQKVIQNDRNKRFLALSSQSCRLNGLDEKKMDIHANDFFKEAAGFKKTQRLFDCVILDPPFFSSTSGGTVDLVNQSMRLINKCRPLVKDGGRLVSINNALFISGREVQASLEGLSKDGYMQIETVIPIPEDITGYARVGAGYPADPYPYNHPTKITILKVRRKATS